MAFMHFSPSAETGELRMLPCTSPEGCPYKHLNSENVGVPKVHGDLAFMTSVMEYVGSVNAEIAAKSTALATSGQKLDTPEFREWLTRKLKDKTNPPIREMEGAGYANDDPWAPWLPNGEFMPRFQNEQERAELRMKYPQASEKWIRKKIEIETRQQPTITQYNGREAYTLDYEYQDESQAITGTPSTDMASHDVFIYTRDPFIQANHGGILNLDQNEEYLFIADYESNPARIDRVECDYNSPILSGMSVEHIQGYRGARPYFTPTLADNPKVDGLPNRPDYDFPDVVLSAPLIRKDADDKERAWVARRKAGESITGNAYRSGAFEMTGGFYNYNSATITTDHLRVNDQNGDYIQTPHVYAPVFNRNSTVLNIKSPTEARFFEDRFITYDEAADTYSIDWKKLHDAGIDMLVFDECKELWDNAPNPREQRGFAWEGLDHSMQAYIVNGSAVCGWVRYDTGVRYAPYGGARGGGH